MTSLHASLETVLRGIELTSQDQTLLQDYARLRRVAAGEELYRNPTRQGDMSLLILISGRLRITRRPLPNDAAQAAVDSGIRPGIRPGIRIVARDLPVLVPPPRPALSVRSETEIEIIDFSNAHCAFLLGTCRAFRALVFAAANAGVSQLTESDEAGAPRAALSLPPRLLH